jgi:capsid protein
LPPVRAAWMDMAVLSGVLVLDDYTQRRREYLRTRWVPQGWAYIQPVQDVQARRMEVQAGFASRSEMVLRTGYDAETVDAENAADLVRPPSASTTPPSMLSSRSTTRSNHEQKRDRAFTTGGQACRCKTKPGTRYTRAAKPPSG